MKRSTARDFRIQLDRIRIESDNEDPDENPALEEQILDEGNMEDLVSADDESITSREVIEFIDESILFSSFNCRLKEFASERRML